MNICYVWLDRPNSNSVESLFFFFNLPEESKYKLKLELKYKIGKIRI